MYQSQQLFLLAQLSNNRCPALEPVRLHWFRVDTGQHSSTQMILLSNPDLALLVIPTTAIRCVQNHRSDRLTIDLGKCLLASCPSFLHRLTSPSNASRACVSAVATVISQEMNFGLMIRTASCRTSR